MNLLAQLLGTPHPWRRDISLAHGRQHGFAAVSPSAVASSCQLWGPPRHQAAPTECSVKVELTLDSGSRWAPPDESVSHPNPAHYTKRPRLNPMLHATKLFLQKSMRSSEFVREDSRFGYTILATSDARAER